MNINIATVTVNGVTYAAGGDPGGMMRSAWRVSAWHAAGGKCATCGKATRLDATPGEHDRAEAGHVLPGQGRGGYQFGNIINMCRACNRAATDRDLRGDLPLFAHRLFAPKPEQAATVTQGDGGSAESRRAAGFAW